MTIKSKFNNDNKIKKTRQQRNTIQQKIIADTVKSMPCHPSPDEVYSEINRNYPSIGRATVYRVLNKLADNGEIQKISIPNTADRFDYRIDSHIHIHCKGCNKVFDADIKELDEIVGRLNLLSTRDLNKTVEGFSGEGVAITFYGLCKDCSEV